MNSEACDSPLSIKIIRLKLSLALKRDDLLPLNSESEQEDLEKPRGKEDMEREIRQRTTRQLTVISAAIQRDHSHPNAEDIYIRVRKVLPRISLGTVYRHLQRLVQEGKLQMLFLGERTARYDPTLAEHDHFICQCCGRVEDVWVGRNRQINLTPLIKEGFTVTSHSLAVQGFCQSCGRRRTSPPQAAKTSRTARKRL